MKPRIILALVLSMVLIGSIQGQGEARNIGDTVTFDLPGGATIEMVWIEPGMFIMGSTEEQKEQMIREGVWAIWMEPELPAHQVSISKGFWLGKYELTQGQWESVMDTRPWGGQDYVQEDPNHPVVYVSWEDVQAFIAKLSEAEGDSVYRLPTEAEWEYACRAGTTTRWSFGDDESQLGEYAWYSGNGWHVGERYAHAVGTKLPNPWGLYDMHGNVREWCWDWYAEDYYSVSPSEGPAGPTTGERHPIPLRVARDGSCFAPALIMRSAHRSGVPPTQRVPDDGVRLLRMEEMDVPDSPTTWGQIKSLLK